GRLLTGAGGVPKWPTGSDCKSDGASLRRVESFPHHWSGSAAARAGGFAGVAQLVERQPSKLDVAGSSHVSRSFEVPNAASGRRVLWNAAVASGLHRCYVVGLPRNATVRVVSPRSRSEGWSEAARVAQSAEHTLGKGEVTGSI